MTFQASDMISAVVGPKMRIVKHQQKLTAKLTGCFCCRVQDLFFFENSMTTQMKTPKNIPFYYTGHKNCLSGSSCSKAG